MVSKYNKQVKIGPISKLNKTQLIEHIRKHPKLTVQENEKGVRISVKGEVNIGDKKIKIKKDDKKEEPKEKSEYIKKYEEANSTPKKDDKKEEPKPKKDNKRKRISKPINYDKPAKDVNIMEGKTDKPKSKAIEISKQLKKVKKEKPKIPSITVTEEEKPKKKVIKVRGKYITVKPKEVKADKMDIPKSKAKIRVAPKKEEPKKEEESSDEEDEEITIKTFKPIKEVPNKFKKVWFEYMDNAAGIFGESSQNDEYKELKDLDKKFIKDSTMRADRTKSSSQQMKAMLSAGDIVRSIKKELSDNKDLLPFFKIVIPSIIKEITEEKKKDEEDLKAEKEKIKKQEAKEIKEEKERIKKEAKKEEPKKKEPKMSKKEMIANLRKHNKENK